MTIKHRHVASVALGLVLAANVMFVSMSGRQSKEAGQGTSSQPELVPGQTATPMPDGRWLVIGGQGPAGPSARAYLVKTETSESIRTSSTLNQARAGHSATLLPDGTVLIVGGVGGDGRLVGAVERFDPSTQQFGIVTDAALNPRAYHSATLLTDGRVLLVGGMSADGTALAQAETWDPRTRATVPVAATLETGRARHEATLLEDGRVLISPGRDSNGKPAGHAEEYDPAADDFIPALSLAPSPITFVSGSLPIDGATDVPLDTLIAVRFSGPTEMRHTNGETVTLRGPEGLVPSRVVPAEAGRLVFVTPQHSLLPGQTYVVSVERLTDSRGWPVAASAVRFTTVGDHGDATPVDDEDRNGIDSPWRRLPPLQAAPGVTALAGQVLRLNGSPLPDVTLRIDEKETRTDRTGRFLLERLPGGHHELVIDGRTASTPGRTYGVFEVGVDVVEGRTTALAYTSWMPKIDTIHAVTIASPTTSEVIVTTPLIPGLAVHIPPGTVIKDTDGARATQVSITPIPVDRPPFPLPANVYVPIYFTVQPGGAYLYSATGAKSPGARLFYPNYRQAPAGRRFDFWHYDPDERAWYVYGQGAVASDKRQIVPDEGVSIYEFTGAMVADPSFAPQEGPQPCNECTDGEPVDLGTGLFVYSKTDLMLPDVIPLALTRTYRTRDSRSRAFGIGTTNPYDMFLIGDINPYTYADLILPDGGRVHYVRTSPGTGFMDAVYTHTATPSTFYKSRISWNSQAARWDLRLVDGTVYAFPDAEFATTPAQSAALSMKDRFGNTVTFTRDADARLTRITSPNERWIEFSYDGSDRITQARDNIGRTVTYTYDGSGRLWKVTDPENGVTEFTYDTADRMKTIKDPQGIVYLQNDYDANGRVTRQTLADGSHYQFAYTLNGSNKVTQTEVTDPRGIIRRVTFNPNGYWETDTRAVGLPEQQTTTLVRDPASNFVSSVMDPLARKTTYEYNDFGNVTRITRLADTLQPVPTSATYEPTFHELASVTDPLQHTTTFGYDTRGALTSMTDPLQHQVTLVPNGAGQTASVTDAAGTTQFGYQGGDLVSVTNPLGVTVNRLVDGGGRPLSYTDALGQSTRLEYDALNQVSAVTDALQGVTHFDYDPNGNRLSVTDARSGLTQYTHDNMDRLATRTDPLLQVQRYTYDLIGNLTQFTDRKGQVTTYSYDPLNRPAQVSYADGSTTTYTYDGGNRLRQIADSVTGTITLDYDDLDRLTQESSVRGTVSYTYDAADRRATMTVAGQPTVTYTYDDADRLRQITQGSSTVTFEYDAADRRTKLTFPNGASVEYGYNAASQLTGLTYKVGQTVLGTLTYTYNIAGQRAEVGGTFARTHLPAPVTSTSYNAANQLASWNGATLTYDLNGNLASDGSRTYAWDARNRLAATAGGGTASFQYDAFGRRTSKTLNGATRDMLYDGPDVVQELTGGLPTATMLLGPEVDELLTRSDGAGTRTILPDATRSSVALVDDAGAVQTQYTYQPFGIASATGAASANSAQFTGRDNDGGSLYYYRARYYSPVLQRFLAEDPSEFSAGDPNLYAYVFNNPTSLTDPSGRIIPLIAASAGVGGLVGGGVYVGAQVLSGRYITWRGLVGAAVGGAISGGVGVVAAPLAGWAGIGSGLWGTAIANAGGGLGAAAANAAIDPAQDLTPKYAAASAASGFLGGLAASWAFPTKGMCNFRQDGFPRTWRGVTPRSLGGAAGPNARKAIYQGGAVSVAIGAVGPYAQQ